MRPFRIRSPRLEQLEPKRLLHADAMLAAAEVGSAEGESDQVAEFSLVDVNPTSATFEQAVSPSDYLGKTSAWYFGHAT